MPSARSSVSSCSAPATDEQGPPSVHDGHIGSAARRSATSTPARSSGPGRQRVDRLHRHTNPSRFWCPATARPQPPRRRGTARRLPGCGPGQPPVDHRVCSELDHPHEPDRDEAEQGRLVTSSVSPAPTLGLRGDDGQFSWSSLSSAAPGPAPVWGVRVRVRLPGDADLAARCGHLAQAANVAVDGRDYLALQSFNS